MAMAQLKRSRPIARKKLSEIVEEELELMIRRGEFVEGEQLPSERELMAFFDVGRPSIREALSALSRKGLVKIASGKNARVCRPTVEGILGELSGMAEDYLTASDGRQNFEQLRLFFECSLVRYAAEHATDAQVADLKQALERNAQSLDNPELFSETDIAFHRVITEIPGNPIFMAIHQAIVAWLIKGRSAHKERPELAQAGYRHHVAIFEAIRDHDPDAAEKALVGHLQHVFDHYAA